MKRKGIFFTIILVLFQVYSSTLWARPTTAHDAEKVVTGWLKADPQPLGAALGQQIINIETFTDDSGEPIYYIVYLQPAGFVIVPADDLVEPIIGFVEDGIYDSSPDNPLGALVTNDLNGRVAMVRDVQKLQATSAMEAALKSQAKWDQLTGFAEQSGASATTGLPSVSDPRVDPLVQSKWDQETCCTSPALACYNYYTPRGEVLWDPGNPNNYPCGCVATAMAQVMRYHRHPTTATFPFTLVIKVDDVIKYVGAFGGPYSWNDMVMIPDCSTTNTQRQAIGMLCYDAGVSVSNYSASQCTNYKSNVTIAWTENTKTALTTTFKYGNAIWGSKGGANIGYDGLNGMVNPNLNAAYPVILDLCYPGHAVVCDGYGYNSLTMYHHLNMGWAGSNDAWYNLPNVTTTNPNYTFTSVRGCVYNIFPSGSGEIISGRVTTPDGEPIATATVQVSGMIGWLTSPRGIYAQPWLQSNTIYTVTVTKAGYIFSPASQNVTTGTSSDYSATSGNIWGVDFVGFAGDFDGDGDIDLYDFAIFALAWSTESGQPGWNPDCDISIPANDSIDMLDLAVFVDNWLLGV